MSMGPAELLGALSYMTDVNIEGSYCHSWRMGLVAQQVASALSPEIRRDVFLGALVQDMGAVGAENHITRYKPTRYRIEDPGVKGHPARSAAILDWLPGMKTAAEYVRSHHGAWPGRHPGGIMEDAEEALGAQILRIVDAASLMGCLGSSQDLADDLRSLARLTGQAWSREVWGTFVESIKAPKFCAVILDPELLRAAIAGKLAEIGIPEELNNAKGAEQLLHVFALLVDLKDPSTRGHSMRIARYAEELALKIGMSADEAHTAYRAGLVHDCGRLGIPTSIINRSGRLNEKEMNIVRQHAGMTMRTLTCLPDTPELAALADLAGHDHERYDGTGYPDGLAGESIPLVSRILSVVDSFDAMVSPTNYRLLTPRCAAIRLQQGADTQFDPKVVEVMLEAVNSGGLSAETQAAA